MIGRRPSGSSRQQAANDGLTLAQYALGMLYSNGRGIQQDWIKARLWLDLAVSGGYVGGGYVGAAQPLEYATSQLDEKGLTRARDLAREWQAARTAVRPN